MILIALLIGYISTILIIYVLDKNTRVSKNIDETNLKNLDPILIRIEDKRSQNSDTLFNIRFWLIKFISYGLPLTIWLGLATLVNVSDRFVISNLVNLESAGIYSAIYDIVSKSFVLFLSPILIASQPRIMSLWNSSSKSESLGLIKSTIALQFLISLPFVIILYLSKDLVINFIFNENNSQLSLLVLPISLGAILWQVAATLNKFLEIKEKNNILVFYMGLTLLFNLVINVLLIPTWGYTIASYTTLISCFLYFFLVLQKVYQTYSIAE